MNISQDQFNRLNAINLTLIRKIDTKTYDEMCDILNDIYKTDIAESEECAKEITVDSVQTLVPCNGNCTIRGYHKHTDTF